MSGASHPDYPQSAVTPPRRNAGEKSRARARRGPFAFLVGSALSFAVVIAILLADLGPSGIDFILMAVGMILWAVGLRRAKTISEKITLFLYISAFGAILGYLLYTTWVVFYGPSQALDGIGFVFLLASPVSGLLGVFLSETYERVGGAFLVAGSGLGLLVWEVIDAPLILVPILWWGVPFAFGLAILTRNRKRITSKGLALMGFASLLLPWFTGTQSTYFTYGTTTTSFNFFLLGVFLQGTSSQGIGTLSYNWFVTILAVPLLAAVVAGSTIFLRRDGRMRGSDLDHRKRSVLPGLFLIVASVIAGSIFTIVGNFILFIRAPEESAIGLPSAGCWLALVTGFMMTTTPLALTNRETAATGPDNRPSYQLDVR